MKQQRVVVVEDRAFRYEDLPAIKRASATLRKAIKLLEAVPSSGAPVKVDAERFWDLYCAAVSAIRAELGDHWTIKGETVLFSLPPRLRSYRGPKGGTIRYRRDHRAPAARYWPGGVIPAGVEMAAGKPPTYSREAEAGHERIIRRQRYVDAAMNAKREHSRLMREHRQDIEGGVGEHVREARLEKAAEIRDRLRRFLLTNKDHRRHTFMARYRREMDQHRRYMTMPQYRSDR